MRVGSLASFHRRSHEADRTQGCRKCPEELFEGVSSLYDLGTIGASRCNGEVLHLVGRRKADIM